MSKEQKMLNEVISTLIASSNVVESIRGKLSVVDKANFLKAQEHLVASIQYMKRGKYSIDKSLEPVREEKSEGTRGL